MSYVLPTDASWYNPWEDYLLPRGRRTLPPETIIVSVLQDCMQPTHVCVYALPCILSGLHRVALKRWRKRMHGPARTPLLLVGPAVVFIIHSAVWWGTADVNAALQQHSACCSEDQKMHCCNWQ